MVARALPWNVSCYLALHANVSLSVNRIVTEYSTEIMHHYRTHGLSTSVELDASFETTLLARKWDQGLVRRAVHLETVSKSGTR
jgi:hypothetical protein